MHIESVKFMLMAQDSCILKSPEDRPGEPIKLAELTDPEGNGFMISEYVS